MILRVSSLLAALSLIRYAAAEIAPEITVVAEGYNLLAKLPCISCPFLYQDTSNAENGPWKSRDDENALLLNISLPFTSSHLSINSAPILSSSEPLPRIYATQVLLDVPKDSLADLVATNSLDNPGSAVFGTSYAYSVHRIQGSPHALLFHFDVFEIWSDLPSPALTVKLNDPKQQILEVVLLQRPLLSSGDVSHAFEIVRVGLVPRSPELSMRTMHFHDWDAHGEKGTSAHLISSTSDRFVEYISSGVWGLFMFLMAIIALFVVLCLFCIFGCGLGKGDEYERAQHGKKRVGGRGDDVEKAKGRFMNAEELGLRSGARVVGVGKSD